tara:strand:- start:330 stop:845 length:516 start_codon:yes stop_codon:yes gene_type:complete
MNYVQTQTDKEDEKLLKKLLSEKIPEKDAKKIINNVFSDLIKWTYEDVVLHLTQVFNFTEQESNQLIKDYDIISFATTKEVIMNPAPNFNATAPNDVKDYSANLWQARKCLSDANKLINATALTPKDYPNQSDFQDAALHRLHLQEHFVSINKYIDEHLDFAKHYIPPQTP